MVLYYEVVCLWRHRGALKAAAEKLPNMHLAWAAVQQQMWGELEVFFFDSCE